MVTETSILLLIVIVFACYKLVSVYNLAKTLLVMRDEAIANILLYKTKRFNLIEQLLRLVRTYNLHEQHLLENIANSFGKENPDKPGASLVGRIAALHMHFPEVKAQELYGETMNSLNEIEAEIQKARERVNRISKSFNTHIVTFPNNLFAALFTFNPVRYIDESTIDIMEEELRALAKGEHL